MSSDDPQLKRMSVMIVLIIFVLFFNLLQAVMLNIDDPYNEMLEKGKTYSATDEPTENPAVLPSFDFFGFIWSFLTFFTGGFIFTTLTELPLWMSPILIPIYIILLIGFWFLIIDYIKDINILGSSL